MTAKEILISIVLSAIATSGFWTLLNNALSKRSARARMVIGLGHDRIMYLGMKYIKRGWITADEYENLHDYLYVPYKDYGGNGSAARVMAEVDKLPIRDNPPKKP